jgi:hypothetical protein
MKPGAKVLIAAAILCFVVWGVALSVGLQPLFAAPGLEVLYGEGEEFHADAQVLHKARNESFLLLHLPHARPDHRWWTVDLKQRTIARSGPPRSLGSLRYMLRGDLVGTKIGDGPPERDWSVRFPDNGAAFAGEGFVCSVRRNRK